ncbi:sensor histidine kinase [Virgisporangium ochraceum]|uniref:histidine kinase n=1 Tax=Virgisporangium ochraceum TaxID=65505 RepID=A0A8J4A3W9_9ACTN|nr:sensor histidine kinase [Virgisporangium ochraceum]GIJ72306.1 two-component sensor histidine kinase [Virgisporangium ochraceum]
MRSWPGRHPWVVDTVVAVLAFAVSAMALVGRSEVTGTGPTARTWLASVAVCLPLVWRRRAPVVVFCVVMAVGGLTDSVADTPASLFCPLFAVYAVARHRPRVWLVPVAVAFEAVIVGTLIANDLENQDVIAVTALLAASVFLGMNLRTRRAYLDQLEERAARLERERDQQARLAAAGERARIARELHDIVAHNLTVMVALAEGAAATVPTAPDRAVDVMDKVAATGRLALVEMRRMVGVLRTDEAPRGPQPGLADLDPLVDQVRAAGMRVELTRRGEPGAWGPGAGLAVYRIVQEALTNALKHAGPRAVTRVGLRFTADGADIEVVDDGAGRVAVTPGADGHGLPGMAERAASFGGRLEAGPGAGAGWRVRASLRFPTEDQG